jgi:hypothetical protein
LSEEVAKETKVKWIKSTLVFVIAPSQDVAKAILAAERSSGVKALTVSDACLYFDTCPDDLRRCHGDHLNKEAPSRRISGFGVPPLCTA